MKRGQDIIGISATRGSAILGLNKWKTPVLAWQELMEKIKPGFNAERGFTLPPREDKAVFRWGHAFESSVIELAEQAQDSKIGYQEHLCRNGHDGNNPESFCYIDGMYQTTGRTLHEGKTTFERAFNKSWGEPGTDRVPQHIQIQVQHQMMCAPVGTVADECIVSVLVFPFDVEEREAAGWIVTDREHAGHPVIEKRENIGDSESSESMPELTRQKVGVNWYNTKFMAQNLAYMGNFHQYPVESKPDTQKLLREMYEDFWNRYILTEKEPEITDYDDIKRLFTAPKGELILPDHMIENCREYSNITKEIGSGGDLTKRKEQIKIDVLKYLRKETTVESDDAQEKIVLLDQEGNNIGSYNGKVFRVSKKA